METITLTVPHALLPGGRYIEPHFPPHEPDDWLVVAVDGQKITVVPWTRANRLRRLLGGFR